MKNRELFEVFCKALGLYFVILAITNFKDAIFYGVADQMLNQNNSRLYFFIGGQAINLIFNGIVAWVLIAKSNWVASKVVMRSEGNLDFGVNKLDLTELAIIAISGITIIDSLPEILEKITSYIYFNPYSRMNKSEYWANKNMSELIYSIFKLSVGLLIITNARLISRRLTKIGDKSDQLGNV